jgi:BlaR1 peptidase M56
MSWHTPFWHWLAQATLAGSLILVAGCLAVRLCRQPARKIRLAELTLFGCLLAPWLGGLPGLPQWRLGWLGGEGGTEQVAPVLAEEPAAGGSTPASLPPLVAEGVKPSAPPAKAALIPPHVAEVRDTPAEPPATATRLSLPALLVLAYAAVAGWLLLRWLAGVVQLARLCRGAGPTPPAVGRLFRRIAGPRGEGVALLASSRTASPLMFCWWRPVIVLPAELCSEGDTPALRYCLAHEWSHVERRDAWTWHLATLAQFLLFFNPLFWWLRRQVRLCQDFLADARAAEQAAEAEDYAEYLVHVARRCAAEPVTVALGIGDRRSNLYRRILMLIDNDRPLERRCRGAWSFAAGLASLVLLAAVCAVRLDAGTPKEDKKDEKKSEPSKPVNGPTLKYTGRVTDKDTGKPIKGATVTVRRSLLGDPKTNGENKILQETKHPTDAAGKYHFTIPPEQSGEKYLYIELDAEHPEYAAQNGFGYALSMILKNEKMGGRPFFEHIELRPGKAITGLIQKPDGSPAAGVKVLTYSRTTKKTDRVFEYGSFASAKTDAKGRFRAVVTTPGEAVFWILPKDYAPSGHKLLNDRRGDLGTFALEKGIPFKGKVLNAKGKPLAGVYVNVSRESVPEEERVSGVGDGISRSGLSNDKGEFVVGPLAPGTYTVQPGEHNGDATLERYDRKRRRLPGVFLRQRLILKEGKQPEAVEVRAVPHVVIEAQHFDSKGKKTRGHSFFVFGRLDGNSWFGEGKQDADGKVTALVPHGLEQAQLDLMTNEHGVLRHRKTKNDPLSNKRRVDLGTLQADVKGIEIIRYTAPILLVKVVARDGGKLADVGVTATYPEGKGQFGGGLILAKGRNSDVSFEKQEDGRFRSSQLFPDQEATVFGHAEGYESRSQKVKLAEGTTKEIVIELDKKK